MCLQILKVVMLLGCLCLAVQAQLSRRNGMAPPPSAAPSNSATSGRPMPPDVLAEINIARAQPAMYAAYLEEMKKQFKGLTLRRPGRLDLTTSEGVAAVDEAIRFLRAAKPQPALHLSAGMSHGASDQAVDFVKNHIAGHKGSDGSMPEDRIARYGRLLGNDGVGENIAYDGSNAREVVMGFIVDDGTSDRGHRRNLFSSTYKVVGIGIGNPPKGDPSYVVTFAGGYTEGKSMPPKGK